MSKFRKTQIMNIIGASGLAILGVALFLNKVGEQPPAILITIIIMYALLVFVPAGTALSLSHNGGQKLRRSMLTANWALIILWLLSVISSFLLHSFGGASLVSAIFFVVPEWLNIRALRSVLASQNSGDSGMVPN